MTDTDTRELTDAELDSVVAGKEARSVGTLGRDRRVVRAVARQSTGPAASPAAAAPSGCPGGVCPLARGGPFG